MVTCKFCGQELQFIGENHGEHHFNCTFCDMTFLLEETSAGRKRKMSVPESIETLNFYSSTKEFLECDTINLYYTLKDIREFWYHLKSLLETAKVKLKDGELVQNANTDSGMDEVVKELMKEYTVITKKKFVVENILLDRTGFLPEKLTEDFLSEIYEAGQMASKKAMYVYIK